MIQLALNNRDIRERLLELDPSDESVWHTDSSVETAIRTAATGSGLTPQLWMAQAMAGTFDHIDLRLRTSSAAKAPIVELLAASNDGIAIWAEGVIGAARQVFMNALEAEDDETGLRRVDILPFRALEDSEGLALPVPRPVGKAILDYWDLWDELLTSFGRRLKDTVDWPTHPNEGSRPIAEMLRMLGQLEDAFLARAVGTKDEFTNYFADCFALAVYALLEGITTEEPDSGS